MGSYSNMHRKIKKKMHKEIYLHLTITATYKSERQVRIEGI